MQVMDITYLGHSAFKIKGKHIVIITDPYSEKMVGLKFPRHLTGDIVTVSHDHDDHNFIANVEGKPFVVNGPGEYEIKDTAIMGLSTFHDGQKGSTRGKNTMYRIELDGLVILHGGDLGHTLSDHDLDELGNVDILLVPVGGTYTCLLYTSPSPRD